MQPPPLTVATTRPKVLTTAAILCFVFGALGLFGIFGALMAMSGTPIVGLDSASAKMMSEPTIVRFQVIGGIISAAGGAVLLAAGVGLLKCQNWARTLTVGWSIFYLLNTGYGSYMTVKYILPVTQKAMEAQVKAQGGPGANVAMQIGSAAGMIGAVFGIVFAVAVAVTLIVLVTRPQAKAACRRAAA